MVVLVYLDLLLVEHAQPLQVDHVGDALAEGEAVGSDLLVQPVVRHQMDVGDPISCRHRDVLSPQLQLNHLTHNIQNQVEFYLV